MKEEPMHIYRMESSPLPQAEPEDYESELLTFERIRDACASTNFWPGPDNLTQFGKLTSWISRKLSLLSVEASKEGREELSTKLGIASIEAAISVHDSQQYFSNLLDQAQVLMQFHKLDDATEILYHIVLSPDAASDHARPGAHVGLASIYRLRNEKTPHPKFVDDALYHLERGLRYVHSSVTLDMRQLLLELFAPLYAKADDLAGLAHCLVQLGKPSPMEQILQLVTPGKSIERAIFLASRFRALEEHELADAVFAAWHGIPGSKPV